MALRGEVGKAVVGQDAVVTGLIVALLCRGHVLLEGVPGVAKTLLVRALAASLDLEAVRERRESPLEITHAQRDVLERAAIPRSVGREERQLPPPRVRTHERERVRPVDHVHPEMGHREVRDRIAVREPVGDVVEGLRVHAGRCLPCPPRLIDRLVVDVVLVRVLLGELVDDVHSLAVGVVDLHERVPLVRQRVLGEDRLHGTLRLAGAAVDALLGVDDEDPVGVVDAVDRAHVDTGAVFDVDAGFGDDVRHCALL
jgi:hypothetical protein